MLAAIRPRQRRPWAYTPGELDFEVGFYLANRRWGQGFAAEAAYAALKDPRKDCSCPKSMPITDRIIALRSET